MRIVAFLLVLLTAAAASGPAYALVAPRQTARRAEFNVLHAVRVLGRLSPGLIDPATNLLKNNSSAHCAGVGRAKAGAYTSLVCVVASRSVTLKLRYIVLRHNGFELRRIPPAPGR